MSRKTSSQTDSVALPMLVHETLYIGVDVGKKAHVAGFLSSTLLTRHQRFEQCPALAFDNSREGFRSLIDRIRTYVPFTQVQAVLEVTGHYHRALLQYLQEVDIPKSVPRRKHTHNVKNVCFSMLFIHLGKVSLYAFQKVPDI